MPQLDVESECVDVIMHSAESKGVLGDYRVGLIGFDNSKIGHLGARVSMKGGKNTCLNLIRAFLFRKTVLFLAMFFLSTLCLF
jgi:hypothetical protein